jgi:hypothetical protein
MKAPFRTFNVPKAAFAPNPSAPLTRRELTAS